MNVIVIHSDNFVDSLTGKYTLAIEESTSVHLSKWKVECGTSSGMIDSYFYKFM